MDVFNALELPKAIDYALWAADATKADLAKFFTEARSREFRAVCVNGGRVELAYAALEESNVQVVALVGFPFGAGDADAKRYETEIAVDNGAHEIEAVVNIGRLKDGDHTYVLRELRDVVEAADERPVNAILETHLLTFQQKVSLCQLALDSGVKGVVTASGVNSPKVQAEEIHWLRGTLGDAFIIKAVGQITSVELATQLMNAGANRLGVLAGVDWFS